MKKIPYGISNYEELITEGYYYVDKTSYLKELEDSDKKLIYLRPRRFGKTLFTSMMYYYYDINSSDKFDTLFKDTAIYKEPTKNKNNYYVLKLDFSGMAIDRRNIEDIEAQFIEKIVTGIRKFIKYYDLDMDINYNGRANQIILRFLSSFESLFLDKKIYVIIDEYDKFTNAILEGDADLFKSILGKDGFVRAFYEPLKEYSGAVIDRIFITGVCSISVDAMTSGFNVATNITNDNTFNAMTALTHAEVRKLISDVDNNKQEEIFNTMLEYYDGYKFSVETEEKVFNPTLVMYYLSNYHNKGHAPRELFDKNIISSFRQIKNVITINNNKEYIEILNSIFNTRSVSGLLLTNFDIDVDIDRDMIISLLYYFGYITITGDKLGKITYEIPNKVIEKIFYDYFLYILEQDSIKFEDNQIDDAVLEIATTGNITKLTKMVEKALAKSSNRVLSNFSEKNIQVMYSALLSTRDVFNIYNEYETEKGYVDLMIFKKDKDTNYDVMIEFKYIKKGDYKPSVLEKNRLDAIKQIYDYIEDDRIDKTNLRKFVVIFVGKKLVVLEEIV